MCCGARWVFGLNLVDIGGQGTVCVYHVRVGESCGPRLCGGP